MRGTAKPASSNGLGTACGPKASRSRPENDRWARLGMRDAASGRASWNETECSMETIGSAPEAAQLAAGNDATMHPAAGVPVELSEHIARCCAKRGAKMVRVLREVIEERFPLK